MSREHEGSVKTLREWMENAISLRDVFHVLPLSPKEEDPLLEQQKQRILIEWIEKQDWKEMAPERLQGELEILTNIAKLHPGIVDWLLLQALLFVDSFCSPITPVVLELLEEVRSRSHPSGGSFEHSVSSWLQRITPHMEIIPESINIETASNAPVMAPGQENQNFSFSEALSIYLSWWTHTYHRQIGRAHV